MQPELQLGSSLWSFVSDRPRIHAVLASRRPFLAQECPKSAPNRMGCMKRRNTRTRERPDPKADLACIFTFSLSKTSIARVLPLTTFLHFPKPRTRRRPNFRIPRSRPPARQGPVTGCVFSKDPGRASGEQCDRAGASRIARSLDGLPSGFPKTRTKTLNRDRQSVPSRTTASTHLRSHLKHKPRQNPHPRSQQH